MNLKKIALLLFLIIATSHNILVFTDKKVSEFLIVWHSDFDLDDYNQGPVTRTGRGSPIVAQGSLGEAVAFVPRP